MPSLLFCILRFIYTIRFPFLCVPFSVLYCVSLCFPSVSRVYLTYPVQSTRGFLRIIPSYFVLYSLEFKPQDFFSVESCFCSTDSSCIPRHANSIPFCLSCLLFDALAMHKNAPTTIIAFMIFHTFPVSSPFQFLVAFNTSKCSYSFPV